MARLWIGCLAEPQHNSACRALPCVADRLKPCAAGSSVSLSLTGRGDSGLVRTTGASQRRRAEANRGPGSSSTLAIPTPPAGHDCVGMSCAALSRMNQLRQGRGSLRPATHGLRARIVCMIDGRGRPCVPLELQQSRSFGPAAIRLRKTQHFIKNSSPAPHAQKKIDSFDTGARPDSGRNIVIFLASTAHSPPNPGR